MIKIVKVMKKNDSEAVKNRSDKAYTQEKLNYN